MNLLGLASSMQFFIVIMANQGNDYIMVSTSFPAYCMRLEYDE